MSTKPIFVATHPRACSTAFERVFMTRRDILKTVHEPFGDAFYYGPERLSERYENDENARVESGFSESTFKTIFDRINRENTEGKRLFIKDITHYLVPPHGKPASIAPSLLNSEPAGHKRGVGTDSSNGTGIITSVQPVQGSEDVKANGTNGTNGVNGHTNGAAQKTPYPYPTVAEPGNPSVVPAEMLKQFHFTFLIRHPKYSIPSYYRCTIPPLDEMTGFYNFMPSEAGYDELRRVFDYLRQTKQVGPKCCDGTPDGDHKDQNVENGFTDEGAHGDGLTEICVIDADDLLDNPKEMIEAYCKSVGIDYSPEMLKWGDEESQNHCQEQFAKWHGFHEDAINSNELKQRTHKKVPKSDEQLYKEWAEKYGEKGAKVIKDTVEANIKDYEYLKQFAIKV